MAMQGTERHCRSSAFLLYGNTSFFALFLSSPYASLLFTFLLDILPHPKHQILGDPQLFPICVFLSHLRASQSICSLVSHSFLRVALISVLNPRLTHSVLSLTSALTCSSDISAITLQNWTSTLPPQRAPREPFSSQQMPSTLPVA